MDSSFNIQNYFKRGKTVVLTLRHGDADEVRQWSDKDTSQLLSLMNESLPEFQNQRRRKKEVWADISKKLSDGGYCWTPEDCRKKWSNMVRTFKGIQEQKQDPTLSSKRIKWPFFEYMGELLALEGADYLPEATSIVQLLNSPMQPPSSPTAILSMKNNEQRSEEQSSSSTRPVGGRVSNNNGPDMVGVAADLASIINASSGDEIGLIDSLRPVDMDQNRVAQEGSSTSKAPQNPQQQLPLKTIIKTGKRVNGKRTRAKSGVSSDNPTTSDGLMEKFINMTNRNNELLLEQLTAFQNNALEMMQQRNDILSRLCSVLEQQNSTCEMVEEGHSVAMNNLQRYQFEETDRMNNGDPIQVPQDNTVGTFEITGGGTIVSTNVEDRNNVGDLNDGLGNDTVAVVDTESLQTLISQDSVGGLTFHLDVPNSGTSSENEPHRRLVTDQKGNVRLETIPSDVFSATLPPYFVSVIQDQPQTKKTRFSLSKQISVPLHQGHRKIAPRK